MPVARMRMRPWLEQKIESNTISGLTWVDKDKTLFSIPWKHAARHGWDLDTDACIFKQWAIHTGKHVEGQTCDPKTWKANFRCAMNSLPDIKEVKDKSVNKGHQAMRVFRMLPPYHKCRDKQRKAKETRSRKKSSRASVEDDVEEKRGAQSPVDKWRSESTQESTVDSTVNTESQDFPFALSEVPDCSMSVEINSDFLDFCHRFEVSPEYSTNYDCLDFVQEMDKEKPRILYSLDERDFLSSEAGTSPGSQWSESSSACELDSLPRYTTLSSNHTSPTDHPGDSFFQQLPQIH